MPYLVEAQIVAVPIYDSEWEKLPLYLQPVAMEMLQKKAGSLAGPWEGLFGDGATIGNAIYKLDQAVFQPALAQLADQPNLKTPLETRLMDPHTEIWIHISSTTHLVYRPLDFTAKDGAIDTYLVTEILQVNEQSYTVNGTAHLKVIAKKLMTV